MNDFSDYFRQHDLRRLLDEATAAARLVHSYEDQISRLHRAYELNASTHALSSTFQEASNAARLYDQAYMDQIHRLAATTLAELPAVTHILAQSSLQSVLRDHSSHQRALEMSRDLLQTNRNQATADLVSLPQKLAAEAGRLANLQQVEYLTTYQLTHQIVLDNIARALGAIPAESLASQYAYHLTAVEGAGTIEEREALLEELVAWWSKLLSTLRASGNTVLTLLDLLLTLLVFAYQEWGSNQMELRLSEKIFDSEQRMASQIETLRPTEQRQLLLVSRRLRLRDGPSVHEKTLRVLNPGVVVEELDRQGNWVFVECFDVGTGEQNTGWVYGRYLRSIPPSSPHSDPGS
jgi:hypothetical protein